VVDIRHWSETTHTFAVPLRLQKNAGSLSGGLGENYDTGELAAVWAQGGNTNLMRLYLSADGGKKFTPAQDVATIGFAYGVS
jgi:hypothetical protein